MKAFLVGGLICVLSQILLEKTKMLPGRIMVLLVCSGVVLSFFGLFEPLKEFAGAGATVPLLGFGHVLMEGVKEAVDERGFIGLFIFNFFRRGILRKNILQLNMELLTNYIRTKRRKVLWYF